MRVNALNEWPLIKIILPLHFYSEMSNISLKKRSNFYFSFQAYIKSLGYESHWKNKQP